MKPESFSNFRPLWTEQAQLIERGVRAIALTEGLANECARDNVADLVEAARGARVFAFAFNRHMAGYASHEWAIDLLGWAMNSPQPQRNRIVGLLCGYSPEAIKQFEEKASTVEF